MGGGASFWRIVSGSPADSTPYGRPLLALSFAANHAISGFDPWSYRALNLALHLGSALLLFDLIRGVLRAKGGERSAGAEPIALCSALLFLVHPLATSVVTYTVQRAEGMMAFFYLATLAASARALGGGGKAWSSLAVAACALGMATKETMATAPLAVLLLHRSCFASSWREVLRRRPWHLALASTWLILAVCMWTWPRRQSVGFGFEDMNALDYLAIQTGAWWHYLGVLFAPWRIAIDHWPARPDLATALAAGGAFAALYLGLVVWTWRRSATLGAGLLLPGLILLPTSTLIPIFTSPVADHRMYLPSAFALTVVTAAVLALGRGLRRFAPFALLLWAAALAALTVRANRGFRSERTVWENALARDAQNPRAWNNLGLALANEGLASEGEARIAQALRLGPGYADAWYNLGTLQGRDGRLASAEESFRRAISLRPGNAAAHCNLAVVLARRGRPQEAILGYRDAIRIRPDYPTANFNLAVLYFEAGDYDRALAPALACLDSDPLYPNARRLVDDLKRLSGR